VQVGTGGGAGGDGCDLTWVVTLVDLVVVAYGTAQRQRLEARE
jgi:hypothetical protein